MAVAPSVLQASAPSLTPSLAQARELARAHNLIPLTYSFISDCETPVSAFLKLRALAPGEPAFLLESAEQAQRVGRWSFIGFRPALDARRRRRPVRARGRARRACAPGAGG